MMGWREKGVVCLCWSKGVAVGAAGIREAAVDPVSCQTIDADQPLLTMQ